MRIRVNKEDLIEAIALEPLSFGAWANTCTYCAIGAVVHRMTDIESAWEIMEKCLSITEIGGDCTPNGEMYDIPTRWPNILSSLWEWLTGTELIPVEEARTIILDWIEVNVPDDEVLWEMQS
jgi:hypothetical protein